MLFVLAIIAIVFTAGTIQKYLDTKNAPQERDPEVDELLTDIERLEERIRVLERIVTEDKHDLRREIDRLR
jgi:hypothetical protein